MERGRLLKWVIIIILVIILVIGLILGGKTIKEKREQKKAALRVTIVNKSTQLPPESQNSILSAIQEGYALSR